MFKSCLQIGLGQRLCTCEMRVAVSLIHSIDIVVYPLLSIALAIKDVHSGLQKLNAYSISSLEMANSLPSRGCMQRVDVDISGQNAKGPERTISE